MNQKLKSVSTEEIVLELFARRAQFVEALALLVETPRDPSVRNASAAPRVSDATQPANAPREVTADVAGLAVSIAMGATRTRDTQPLAASLLVDATPASPVARPLRDEGEACHVVNDPELLLGALTPVPPAVSLRGPHATSERPPAVAVAAIPTASAIPMSAPPRSTSASVHPLAHTVVHSAARVGQPRRRLAPRSTPEVWIVRKRGSVADA